jgi:hypothetical protein
METRDMARRLVRSFFAPRLAVAVAMCVSAFAATAHADESEGERLFKEGRALMLAGRFAEACPVLEESQRVEPHGGTLLNVAACHERIGRVATAWAEFHDALAAARAEGHDDRRKLAEERIAALSPRLPWLVVTVTAEAADEGARVTFDGVEIQRIAWGKDMPIDPGEHAVVVTAPGRVERRWTLVAREGERQTVEIRGLLAVAPPPEPAPAPPAEPAPSPPPPVEPAPPPRAEPPPSPHAPRFGRWVFEAGLFVGYLNGDMDPAQLGVDPGSVPVTNGSRTTSCGQVSCSYTIGRQGGVAGGVDLFAGYAARDWLHVGGRMLAAPRAGGGMLFATGPSVSLHMVGPLWAGASLYLGYASQSSTSGTVTPTVPYALDTSSQYPMSASTGLSYGAGFELRCELFHVGSGTFALDTQPFFLAGGNGSAFVLPLGLSYRWR